jgi:LPS sulfotransferase NodH
MTTKFILTGFPRTGTTVLAGSILIHPDVLFYGEIFSNTPEVRNSEAMRITMGAGWKLENQLDYGMQACSFTGSAGAYLDKMFSRDIPFKVVGFKIMFDQSNDGPNSDVWNYISDHTEIKIISTRRDSLLEIICSYVRAHMTRRWHLTGETLPNHKFIVPADKFIELVQKFESRPEQMDRIVDPNRVLELDYSKISNDFTGCMSDIYSFLDLEPQGVAAPRLTKIARMQPNEELANYAELKEHFKNTPYSKYFVY